MVRDELRVLEGDVLEDQLQPYLFVSISPLFLIGDDDMTSRSREDLFYISGLLASGLIS